jgi:stage III sporulation protein AB
MLIKLIGAAVILAASAALGVLLSMKESYRIRDIEEVRTILRRLISALAYDREVLSAAVGRASADSSENIRRIFEAVETGLRNNNAPSKTWRLAFDNNYKHTFLNKEDCEKIKNVAGIFENGDIDLEVRIINGLIDSLGACVDEARVKEARDKRLYRSVCTSIGILLVIILI